MNYLVIGPEEYLKHQFLEKLKKSLLNGKVTQFNFEIFQAGQSEITKILDSFNTLPLLSRGRLTVIKDVEKFSPPESGSILKYLASPLPSTTIVFLSSSNAFNKFLGELSRGTKVVRCARLAPKELEGWIQREFAALKKKISPRLANLMAEKTGEDLFFLKNEIEKLASFAKDAPEVTERHIEMATGKTASETVFELADLVLEKKTDRIFLVLDSLLTREMPHRILSLLAWRFRNLAGIKGAPGLEKKLEAILEGDLFIKRGVMSPRDALERVIVKLCR